MIKAPLAGVLLGIATLAGPGLAADFSDPTWPCIQRKVERLSPGLMWPYPIEPQDLGDDEAHAVAELAERLSLRRTEVEDVRPQVEAFVAAHGGDPALLGAVFQRVFEGLSARRTRIIEGIGDFSLSQIALSEKIESARVEMDTIMAADDPDYDRVDALEEQLDWDTVIYSDRQKSIQYLCETPVLLEKRLFAIAQLLGSVAED